MGALKRKTETIKWRTAGDPSRERLLPGGTSYEPIVLEQGLTQDPVFEAWANLVNSIQGDAAMSLKNFRKNIVLNVLNLQGQVAISYKIYRAWVSDYQAVPELDNRKSTRLNSSHGSISYAVFCLKKKKKYSSPSGRQNNLRRGLPADRARHRPDAEGHSLQLRALR